MTDAAQPAEQATPQRVLGVFAHPDDSEFFAGGTFARWARDGAHITFVVATRGDKGSDDPDMTSEQLVQIREAEQRRAAEILGVQEVIFLNYTDGELFPDLNLRRDVTRMIRLKQPDVVVSLDPTVFYAGSGSINHPDHRAIGAATLEAVFPAARDRLNFPELERDEGLAPHKALQVYIAGAAEPTVSIDITATLETKIQAVCAHQSQVGGREDELAERLRERTLDPDAPPGYPRHVERFRFLQLRG